MPKFTLLWTDAFMLALVWALLAYAWVVARQPNLRRTWRQVAASVSAMCAAVLLFVCLLVAVLDSIHYRPQMAVADGASGNAPQTPVTYSPVVRSLLDDLLAQTRMGSPENTYSAPLALYQFTKETQWVDGQAVREFPRLQHSGQRLQDEGEWTGAVLRLAVQGAGLGVCAALLLAALLTVVMKRAHRQTLSSFRQAFNLWWQGRTGVPWRAMWVTILLLFVIAGAALALSTDYHVLGTDRTGNDVLGRALKSLRTAWIIGTLTTLAMLPPALLFGICAGYFKGWVDDLIQYVYTTLTSIPGVLLIAACVLMMQVYIDRHPELFPTIAARADLRLFLLCLILGLTGWAGLCRLLRAETLKLREMEYVQAAKAFGLSHARIMLRHLLPNLMHIVLITAALEFSGLVLYEAVLSYLGIGVDPSTPSFGTMIDAARLEMARDPMIWWNLLAAFAFMLVLVLSANLFADAVQRAFDPRARRLSGFAVPAVRKKQEAGPV